MVSREKLPLIVGLSIPLFLVVFVVLSVFLPRFFFHPSQDFLYQVRDIYYNDYSYELRSGELVRVPGSPSTQSRTRNFVPVLYVHDVENNKSTEISELQANQLSLDSNLKSVDGYEVVNGVRDEGFFPFFFYSGNDYNTKYLKGNLHSQKLDVMMDNNHYRSGFDFLGWIVE